MNPTPTPSAPDAQKLREAIDRDLREALACVTEGGMKLGIKRAREKLAALTAPAGQELPEDTPERREFMKRWAAERCSLAPGSDWPLAPAHLEFKSHDHPEANGNKPAVGAVEFPLAFALDNKTDLTVRLGQGSFDALCELVAKVKSPAPSPAPVAEQPRLITEQAYFTPSTLDKWNALSDADLNRYFAREFWNRPIDERNGTYWHDDDTTAEDDNHEWKSLPDFCNDWGVTRKLLLAFPHVIPPDGVTGRSERERCRRAMIHMLTAKAPGEAIQPTSPTVIPSTPSPVQGETNDLQVILAATQNRVEDLEAELERAKKERDYLKEYVVPEKDKHGVYWHDLAQQRIAQIAQLESSLALAQARAGELDKERDDWKKLLDERMAVELSHKYALRSQADPHPELTKSYHDFMATNTTGNSPARSKGAPDPGATSQGDLG